MHDPFARLGISATNDVQHIRGAFRRRAALLHPDRHGNSRAASERFKGIVRAYEASLRAARSGAWRGIGSGDGNANRCGDGNESANESADGPARRAPIRERYACPRCDDTFPVADSCPRCSDEVVDTWAGVRREAAEDPRIAELVARLERGPRFEVPQVPIPEGARPWLGALAFVTAGWATASIGLLGLGAMLGIFGVTVASLAAHERLTQDARARLYIF